MRPVVRYQANDGSLWLTEAAAREREELSREIEQLYETLGLDPRPEHDELFLAGRVSLAQPTGTRERLREWVRDHAAHAMHPGPIADVAYRMCCCDLEDREWAEPRFAQLVREPGHVR